MLRLAETQQVNGNDDLEGAQLALRRCLYLTSEAARIADIAPEAAAMVGRSVVEHALIGSYLALYRGGAAAALMKKQRGHARALRDYFLKGDMVAALTLLPSVSFISEPLNVALDSATGMPDLRAICSKLDKNEPFKTGAFASLLYFETYAILSNFVIHATPHSIERHRWAAIKVRGKHRQVFKPPSTFSIKTIEHAVMPAIGGLCGCLARALGMPSTYYDAWLQEADSVDGYEWSGSIARTVAIDGLVELVGLPDTSTLNAAGLAIRVLATLGTLISASPAEQLIVASQVIDRARVMSTRSRFLPLRLMSASSLIFRPDIPARESDKTPDIAGGQAAEHPQALLAALALIYAGLWPDDPQIVEERLIDFDQDAPCEWNALKQLASRTSRKDIRNMHKKWRDQVIGMQ